MVFNIFFFSFFTIWLFKCQNVEQKKEKKKQQEKFKEKYYNDN
jgi:hypothetical protein